LVTNGLHILGVLVGFQNFVMHFLDEVLSQDMAHIDDLLRERNAHVALGILFLCVTCQPLYFIQTILVFCFLSFLANFNKRIMQVCGEIISLESWESIQGPLTRHQERLPISFRGISLLFMEDYAPFVILGN
jgi:hypothetical protein